MTAVPSANSEDISALTNAYAAEIERQAAAQPRAEDEFSWIFEYILENKDLFHVYFKLDVSQTAADYKMLFFRNGAYSVAKMGEIIKREYENLFS